MVFLDHVQNLHIHAEKTHKYFGAHCMKYVNFVHDPQKQYKSLSVAHRPGGGEPSIAARGSAQRPNLVRL